MKDVFRVPKWLLEEPFELRFSPLLSRAGSGCCFQLTLTSIRRPAGSIGHGKTIARAAKNADRNGREQ